MTSAYKTLFIAVPLSVFLLVSSVRASTPEPPEQPRDYIVDLAAVMDDGSKAQLSGLLRELELKTTAQALVLTVQSLDGEDIAGFSLRIAEKWRLGQKGKDNGALVVVAVKDRKYRIETGYGLEGVLPDGFVGTLGREFFVPHFKDGDYGGGISAGVGALARAIAEHEGVALSGLPQARRSGGALSGRPMGRLQLIALAVFGVIALVLFITHPRQCLLLMLASQLGGRRGGWSGGDGFGSGGGFGGGGGGGFGGGGSSGGW
jgi:uncharacterized protein